MSLVTPTTKNPTIAPNVAPLAAGPGPTFRSGLNSNIATVEDKAQLVCALLEMMTVSVGNGAISGGAISIGTGLSVNVAAFAAIVGTYIAFDASQVVGGLTDNTSNYLFLRQDGFWNVNTTGTAPDSSDGHGYSLLWGTAATLSGVVMTVSNVRAVFPLVRSDRTVIDGWYQDNVAASQSAVALARSATPTFGDKLILPRDGSLTALCVKSNAARTAGTLTVEAYIGGVATGLQAILNGTNTTFKATTTPSGTASFLAGDLIDLRITTDSGWLPTTADIRCTLEIET